MKKSVRLWIEALRSGKYKQGKNYLKRKTKSGYRYCCLGVACELYNKTHKRKLKIFSRKIVGATRVTAFYYDSKEADFLPRKVQVWLGLVSEDGAFGLNTLAEKNDAGMRFKEIADIIESKPKGLFK